MSNKVYIDGVEATLVKRGMIEVNRLDEELDTCVIVLYDYHATEYPPFTKIDVYHTVSATPDASFVVDTDLCVEIDRTETVHTYRHTLSCVEPTKVLERHIVDNMAFTQPKDETLTRYTLKDVIYRLLSTTPLARNADLGTTRVAVLDSTLATALDLIKAPQFNFTGLTLRQAIDETLKYINGISRVRSYDENDVAIITKDDFNAIVAFIATSTGYTYKQSQNNSDYFANKFDMSVVNGITNEIDLIHKDPIQIVLTADTLIVTTNDVELILPKPIYALSKLYLRIRYKYLLDYEVYHYADLDLTSDTFEEKLFKTLPVQETGVQSQYGSLVYTKGTNKIRNFGIAFPQMWGLFTTTTLQKILADHPNASFTLPDGSSVSFLNNTFSTGEAVLDGLIGFRVEYYPYEDIRVQVQKELPTNTDNTALMANQSGRSLDISRLLVNAQGALNRLGNGDLTLEKAVLTYSDRFLVGQTTTDGYIVSAVENQFLGDLIKSKATFTKNFNRLSQYIGVDRDFRQYNIPLDETINRNLVYGEYLNVSSATVSGSASTLASAFINKYRYMFEATFESYFGTLAEAKVSTKDADGVDINAFFMPLSKSWGKNQANVHFSFPDNIAGYYYPDTPSSDNVFEKLATVMKPKRYVHFDELDETDLLNGTFELMTVSFLSDTFFKTGTELSIAVADLTAAIADYTAIAVSYPHGLFYKLTTPDTTYSATMPWYFIKLYMDGVDMKKEYYGSAYDVGYEIISYEHANDQWDYLGNDAQPELRHMQDATLLGNFISASGIMSTITDLVVKKDPSEVISLTYQLHTVPRSSDVVIGQTLSKNSPILRNRSTLTTNEQLLRLWRSTDYYRSGDTKAKGTYLSSFTNYSTTAITNGFSVVATASMTGYNSWAIGDVDGNLYFAVNRTGSGTLATTINFVFTNNL